MKRVLFVCYGSGHVRMVLPVARALHDRGDCIVQVLGLTTAAAEVRAARLPLLQFKDFVEVGDEEALATGRRLMANLHDIVDPDETAAYLGLCYSELERDVGRGEAAARYARIGRQSFLPRTILRRVLRRVRPDLVVATNAPRAERAAIEAARSLRIPAVCLVDLFAVDEVRWLAQPDYADRVCVLNEGVRRFLMDAGRSPESVVVTGNPAFDALCAADAALAGTRLRREKGWSGKRILLWPVQVEPDVHPFTGRRGDPGLPDRTLRALVDWTRAQPDAVLCVRPRPGGPALDIPKHPRVVITGQDWPLARLLHAVDLVVTLTSTVGLEGYLAGTRVLQVLGSVFDESMPLARFGMADAAVSLERLAAELDRLSGAGRRAISAQTSDATGRVVAVLDAASAGIDRH